MKIHEIIDLLGPPPPAQQISHTEETFNEITKVYHEMYAAALGAFLPEALPDWTRAEGDSSAAMMGFGGGLAASATYTRGTDIIEI